MWCLIYTGFVVLKLHRLHSYLTPSCLIRVWLLLGIQNCCICISNLDNINVSHEFLDYLGYAFVMTLVTMKWFFHAAFFIGFVSCNVHIKIVNHYESFVILKILCTFMSSFTELTFVFCVYSRHLQQNKTGWFSSVQMQLVEYHISLCRLNILCFGVWNLVGRFTFVSCSNLVVMMSFLKINIVICYTRVRTLTMSL